MSDNRVATFIARIRVPLLVLAAIVLLFGIVLTQWAVSSVSFVLLLVAMALYLRIGTVRAQPIDVRPPVVGRWIPVNGPGSKVPSHGLHAWGQTYAIDLVYKPSGDYRPELVWAPLSRPADSFAGYGQPVVAPAAGTVVRVYDRARDHRSRTSWGTSNEAT